MLTETSGVQTRFAQTMPALTLDSAPRLGHAKWADPIIVQAICCLNNKFP